MSFRVVKNNEYIFKLDFGGIETVEHEGSIIGTLQKRRLVARPDVEFDADEVAWAIRLAERAGFWRERPADQAGDARRAAAARQPQRPLFGVTVTVPRPAVA